VKVVVPPDQMLLLDLNRYAMEHPSSLNEVSEHGIDAIRASFISMDEGQSATDRILKYLPHFRDLFYLDVGGSDTSDAGMENLRQSTKLRYINARACLALHGAFLRLLPSLPNLTAIELGSCSVDQTCFRYLPQMTKLRFLAIDTKTAKREEIKQIGQCHSLVVLKFSLCPELNDQSISLLSTLKNLDTLDITNSPVSTGGVKKLSGLRLSRFALPKQSYSQNELADLKKSFPKTKFVLSHGRNAKLKDAPWSP